MELEKVVGLIALAWLIGSVLVMTRFVRQGRDLSEELATRHPADYERLGRPRPGYLESARRTRFARFVGRREFEGLGDEPLAVRFEAYRKSEIRFMLLSLSSGAIVAVLAWAVRHAG